MFFFFGILLPNIHKYIKKNEQFRRLFTDLLSYSADIISKKESGAESPYIYDWKKKPFYWKISLSIFFKPAYKHLWLVKLYTELKRGGTGCNQEGCTPFVFRLNEPVAKKAEFVIYFQA